MKIVALNFGRIHQQTQDFLEVAIQAATEKGADVELIQMVNKKIERCKGCGACSGGVKRRTSDAPFCVIKDDLREIVEKCLDADALLVACPVYVLAPPGQFFDFVHRFGVAADKAVMVLREEQRKRDGYRSIDQRFLKKQWVGFISVGGCPFHHWVSFGLPSMNTLAFPTTMKVVGAVDIHGVRGSEERRELFSKQCKALGENLVASVGKQDEEVKWAGRKGFCPACHGDIFRVIPRTTKLECPICGITGELMIHEDGQPEVVFTDDAIFHSRMNSGGVIDHCVELHGNEEYCMELYGDKTWVTPRVFQKGSAANQSDKTVLKEERANG